MIDTHCHLDAAEFAVDREAVHAAALAAGVRRIVVPGVAVDGFARLKTTVDGLPACRAAYGIHPLYVAQAGPDDLAILREWLEREPAVAVGEIGLDFYVDRSDPVQQTFFFVEQLKLARAFDLPVILHVRRSVDAVLKELRRIRVRGGIAHAFNGSRQQADEFIKLGFKLGFGGAATYSGSTRIRQLAATLPEEAIVLETDAPDIPPAWLGRQMEMVCDALGDGGGDAVASKARNTPAELPRIAAVLAELRGVPLAQLVRQTTANACAVFGNI